jgi:5-(carboxyamino)imidazole ribonucleotide synthase
MFVHAAQRMGYAVVVLDPDPTSPAGVAANYHVQTDYLDEQGLAQFLQRSSAITIEFENVPANALLTMGSHRHVAPDGESVAICQNRALEKRLFAAAGVPCAAHAALHTQADLAGVGDELFPGILKTSRLGYDGKGQCAVASRAELEAAWQSLGGVPCVLEQRVAIAREFSVVLARGADDTLVHLPLQQNLHREGILAVTQVPAPDATPSVQAQCLDAARRIAKRLNYLGVLCVEFFELDDGRVLANEMAPRPHNSGHYSIDACDVSQFELQVRVLAGLPLLEPVQHSAAVMLNLMGDLWFDAQGQERAPPWPQVLGLPGMHLHLYGKTSARRGRKMGHLTVTAADVAQARERALQAAAILGIAAF